MNVTAQALDVVYGRPAAGIPARLDRRELDGWEPVAAATTDDDGYILDWALKRLDQGDYRIVFDSGSYFAGLGVSAVYPEIAVAFALLDETDACQLQVHLAPYSYSVFFGARS